MRALSSIHRFRLSTIVLAALCVAGLSIAATASPGAVWMSGR